MNDMNYKQERKIYVLRTRLYQACTMSEVSDFWGCDPVTWVTALYSKATTLLKKREISGVGQLLLGLRAAAVDLGCCPILF